MTETNQLAIELSPHWWVWGLFFVAVFALLAIDLGIGQRKAHAPKFGEALSWIGIYVFAALMFAFWIYREYGSQAAVLFITGYLVEYSLSVDNLFVFIIIFSFFSVPTAYRHRALFWGIIGALFFRGIFIAGGALLIHRFVWILYVFGAFLLYTAFKLLFSGEIEEVNPDKNLIVKWARKHFSFTDHYVGAQFRTKIDGKWFFTPLALVLIVIETSDILFAVDSIPAIFSITSNPFLVYTSNVFAILGLRSLFFILDRLLPMFRYLKTAIALILGFIGAKMLVQHYLEISSHISLLVIAVLLTGSIVLSVVVDYFRPQKK